MKHASPAPSILILCTGNSCRSQMAEAFLRSFNTGLEVHSAGTYPAENVHPLAMHVMAETGIDISSARPKDVSMFLARPFDYVITVCDNARESCPLFAGTVGNRLHIGFEDPASALGTDEERLDVFRRVRDEIRDSFRAWYESNLKDTP